MCDRICAKLLLLVSVVFVAAPLCAAQPTPAPRPTPTSNSLPVVSPDGSLIAFTSNRSGTSDVYVIAVDGSGERRLTETAEVEGNLAWSRNGKVLFAIFKDEVSRLYEIDPVSRNQRELAQVPGRGPTLSHDGKRLVYMAGTWTATRLMVAGGDGTNPRQINDGSSIAWNNHWSPNGKRIAFTGRDDPKSELAVFVVNADGSSMRHLTRIPPEEGGGQWPVWSPDGRRLAIQVNSRTQKGSAHIWIVEAATGAAHKIGTHSEAYLDETPSWFPDGKRIAFQSNRTGKMEVWVMSDDGSGARQITGKPSAPGQEADRYATLPVACRNGKRIFFTSERDGRPQLYSMKSDGSDERRVTDLKSIDIAPDCGRNTEAVLFLFLSSENSPAGISLIRPDGAARRALPTDKDVRWPRLSPDGKRVVFTAKNDAGASTIFTMNIDGAVVRPFPSGLEQAWDPAWAPDGRQLAFAAYPDDFKHLDTMMSEVFVSDSDGQHRRLLARVPGLLQLPRWSFDGKYLAYQTHAGGSDANVVVIDVASGEVKTVTHHDRPYLDEAPAWLPDGRLLFQSNRTGRFEVWVMNADGSGQRQLTGR